MQIALQMMRKAQNLDYKGCLQMELNVAFNRIQDKDFDYGVNEVLGKPRSKGNKYRNGFHWAASLKEAEVEHYFEENKHAQGVDLKVVENALLPTKNYY